MQKPVISSQYAFIGRPFVKRFALGYSIGPLSVPSCLSCLSVTFL